jgi:hypothetical protein
VGDFYQSGLFLFALYRQYTEPLSVAMEEKPKRRKK